MGNRYFSDSPITGDEATLSGAEAHHLMHVMRAKAGDRIIVFDGSGCEFDAVVERQQRSTVELRIHARNEVDRESACELTLAVALPKGDRQRWLIEKCVELGVRCVVPLITERGVAQPSQNVADRLRRAVIEASKQCGRNRLMEIGVAARWSDYVDAPPANLVRLIAHPSPEAGQILPGLDRSTGLPVFAAVGPEGGFTDEELNAATAHHWLPVGLGKRILRTETAAVTLAAWFNCRHP